MNISNEGLSLIKEGEGLSLKAYKDIGGIWTIGYGHTSSAGVPKVTPGMTITQKEADRILLADLRLFETAVNKHVKVPLTQSQYDALVSFVYNIGGAEFAKSTLLKKLNKGDYAAVPGELMKWVYVKKNRSQGLVNRRTKEVAMWSKDAWDNDNTVNIERGEIKRETPSVINKENISFAAGTVAMTGTSFIEGEGPVQYALAAVIVIGFGVGLFLFFKRRGA